METADSKNTGIKSYDRIILHPINGVLAQSEKRQQMQGMPSVSLVIGSRVYQTRDLSGGYRRPKWNDIFECEIRDTTLIRVVLWDFDDCGKPTTIGEGSISGNDIKSKGKDCFWVEIFDSTKKKVAKILFDGEYVSADKPGKSTMNTGYIGYSQGGATYPQIN